MRCFEIARRKTVVRRALRVSLLVGTALAIINQGDLLHGDANGVSGIPIEIANEVADVAGEFVACEEIMLDYVKAPGEKSVAKFNELREQFQAEVAKLTERIAKV